MSLFLPVTRPWAIERVMDSLNASDIPRKVLLLIDAPGCDGWFEAFVDSGWNVTLILTHNPEPPTGRVARRPRHLAMRRASQPLVSRFAGPDRVLCIEDDTLVPPDTWTRLSALLDKGYTAASGVQYARHETKLPGIWYFNREAGIMDVFVPEQVCEAAAVGLYCLMTTGLEYGLRAIQPQPDEPIDCAQTRPFAPIAVDPAVLCGHLLESGEVIV